MTGRTKYEVCVCVALAIAVVTFVALGMLVPAVIAGVFLPFRAAAAVIIINEEVHPHD